MVQRSPLGQALGRERMLFNLQTAVERYQQQSDTPENDHASTDKQQPTGDMT